MWVFVLLITVFPSAPKHMGKPIEHGAASFSSLEACRAKAAQVIPPLAKRDGVRYVDGKCVGILVLRQGKESI